MNSRFCFSHFNKGMVKMGISKLRVQISTRLSSNFIFRTYIVIFILMFFFQYMSVLGHNSNFSIEEKSTF